MKLLAPLLTGVLLGGELFAGSDPAIVPSSPGPAAGNYWVYVAAESADEVYLVRFDGRRAVVEATIPVGVLPTEIEGPHGLTVGLDGAHWYLSMAHGMPFGTLYKYSTETNEVVGECELGLFPATMQISAATGLLYCVNFDLHGDMSPSSVSIVDPDFMAEVARTTTGPMPHGSRISPDGLRHYSCAMMSGELFEIDAMTFEVARKLDLEKAEGGKVIEGKTLAPAKGSGRHGHQGEGEGASGAGDTSLSTSAESGASAAEDDAKKKAREKAAVVHGATKPTWVYPHPKKDLIYVALNGANQVLEIDVESFEVQRRFLTDAGPYNVELSPDGRFMVVSYKSAAAVGIWDLDAEKEIAHLASSRRVTHGVAISPDSRYAFVSNEGIGGENGTMDVFDLKSGRKVCLVRLGLQMGGIAFWKMD